MGFLVAVLPMAVFALVTSRTGVLAGLRSFAVLTGSMEPSLPVGAMVFVRNEPEYDIGDVVTFKNKAGNTVTHRIVDTNSGNFMTKGDANNNVDSETVAQGAIIGSRIFVIPYLGRLAGFLKTVPGFVGLIVLPTLIYVGLEIVNIKKEIEKEMEKKVLSKMQATQFSQI